MLINGNLPQLSYSPPVPAPRAETSRRAASEPGVVASRSTASSSVMTSTRARVDVITGVTPRAQRAISAYMENEVYSQRSEYTQLLGVDVYV